MRKLFSLSLMTLVSASMFAGGYRVSIQGQKQLAMGHTGVAVVNSAEVAFFNPAGMSFLDKKFNLSVGANALFAKTRFQNSTYNWQAGTDNLGTPFSVYATYKLKDWVSVGLAVYTPYGSAVEWDKGWQGAHLVNSIDLQAIFVQPTVSFKIGDVFSVGGGPIYANGSVTFNRNVTTNPLLGDTNVNLEAKGITAWGYNVGFMFKPMKEITLGFDYRSEITMEARGGSANYQRNNIANLNPAFTDGTFDADLPLPAEITAGISFKPNDKWLFAFDFNHTKWSVYKALDITIRNQNSTPVFSENLRNYKNSNTYRLGAQYKASNKFTVRGGWYFDESPVQDGYFAPETPRNDSNGYTGGLTYQVNDKLGIDVSFLYLHFDQTDNSYDYYDDPTTTSGYTSFGGTYKSSVFSPGIGITYGF
ncbi:Probable outer membrane protein precursor [Flavobacterium indicum GPTSA100-9 = DSM 17447]|uniref:Probable outer membrane protein n=1 Tax=Flavobacterium indicum (strain DSM 17447 / CIP 109464 / GPTSA100-9) TaxID=1094466 RepID=H8XQ86_FLAIG|nr:outer membrane protein transport protein [Flavobacterium indicum]CCG52380.1 Probable outer membrane protein precursor [Flavobacterium indicum GPTSA100-9 = DSM 17447]